MTVLGCIMVFSLFAQNNNEAGKKHYSSEEKIRFYADLAEEYKYNNTNTALLYCDSARTLLRNSPNPLLEGQVWEIIGYVYYIKGEFDKSFENFINAKNIYDSLGLEHKIAQSYNQLGLIYLLQDDFEKSFRVFNQAIEINLRYDNYDELCKNHLNIGIIKINELDYRSALVYFRKGLVLAEKAENEKLAVRIYTFLGECMLELNELDSSEYHYQKALELTDPKNEWDLCFAKAGYAKLLLEKGEYNQAIRQANESLVLAKNLNALWELERIYKIIAEIEEVRGNYAAALQMFKQYKQVSDSIITVEKNKEILKLEISNKELENDRLKINNQLQQREIEVKNIWLGIGLGFILIFILSIFFLYLNYKKKIAHAVELEAINKTIEEKNEELEKANKTKSRIFSIISHDLVNPLSSIQGILEFVKNETISPKEFFAITDKMLQNLTIVNLTLNNLLHWSRNEIHGKVMTEEKIDLNQLINNTMELMSTTAERFNIEMKYVDCPKGKFVEWNENELSLVIRNLVSNAIKFTPEQGKVTISCTALDDHKLKVSVQDTGIGMTEKQIANILNFKSTHNSKGLHGESGTGLGLLFCMQILNTYGGQLAIQSKVGEGSTFSIVLNEIA